MYHKKTRKKCLFLVLHFKYSVNEKERDTQNTAKEETNSRSSHCSVLWNTIDALQLFYIKFHESACFQDEHDRPKNIKQQTHADFETRSFLPPWEQLQEPHDSTAMNSLAKGIRVSETSDKKQQIITHK